MVSVCVIIIEMEFYLYLICLLEKNVKEIKTC